MLIFSQIEGQIVEVPVGPQPPNPTAKCPIYRWDLQNKYNYTVNAFKGRQWPNKILLSVISCLRGLIWFFSSPRTSCFLVSSSGQMEGCCPGESLVSVHRNIARLPFVCRWLTEQVCVGDYPSVWFHIHFYPLWFQHILFLPIWINTESICVSLQHWN